LKANFEAVDPGHVLERVVAMPISTWNFKEDPGTRHIGPMAQDFKAAFLARAGRDC
jgi:trimeric autotransporter adhesin